MGAIVISFAYDGFSDSHFPVASKHVDPKYCKVYFSCSPLLLV